MFLLGILTERFADTTIAQNLQAESQLDPAEDNHTSANKDPPGRLPSEGHPGIQDASGKVDSSKPQTHTSCVPASCDAVHPPSSCTSLIRPGNVQHNAST